MPRVPKIASLHILTIFKKEGRDEVDLLCAGKHQTFLQFDAINFVEHFRSCPNYQKQQVYTIFAIFQEWSGLLIKLCHGNNPLHMSIKDYFKWLFLFGK